MKENMKKIWSSTLEKYVNESIYWGGLLYGERVETAHGGGKIAHLCADTENKMGWVNVSLDAGGNIHCHHSEVEAIEAIGGAK
jgi:hypothetical protein